MAELNPAAGAAAADRGAARHPEGRAGRRRPARSDLLAVLVLACAALALVAPAFPGTGWTLGGDDALFFAPPLDVDRPTGLERPSNPLTVDAYEVFQPDLAWAVGEVRAGRLPLWNPGVGAGWPLLAAQQTAPLFPLNLPAYVAGASTAEVLGVIAGLGLFGALLGTYVLGRATLRLRPAPALLAALAFGAGSTFVGWLEHPHHNVYLLLPWMLWAADRAVSRGRPRDAGLLAATVGLGLLGGHPQSMVLCGTFVAAFALWRVVPGRPAMPRVSRARAGAALAAGAVLGTASAAVVLLPFVEMLGEALETSRSAGAGLPATVLGTFALPDYWGRPDQAFQVEGPANQLERTGYVGVAALLLAVGGVTVRRDGVRRFLAVATVASLAFVVQLPVVTDALLRTPPWSQLALPRALIVTSLGVALLGGLGLQALLDADAPARRRALAVMGLAALVPLAPAAARLGAVGELPNAARALPFVPGDPTSGDALVLGAVLRWAVLATLALVALALLARGGRARRLVPSAVAALLLLDLVSLGRGQHPVTRTDGSRASAPPLLARALAEQGSERTTAQPGYLNANVGLRYGLRDPRLRGQPVLEAPIGAVGPLRDLPAGTAQAGPALDLLAVRHVLATAERPIDDPSLRLVEARGADRLYRNVDALPRAHVATRWTTAASREQASLATRLSGTAGLRSRPVVELPAGAGAGSPGPVGSPRPPAATGGAGRGSSPTDARIVRDDPDDVRVAVRSPRPGRLVLLDVAYPGWRATVDGREVPIARTNGAFRSVPVPAGASTVRFAYRPASVALGGLLSVLGWTAILAALVLRRRRASSA